MTHPQTFIVVDHPWGLVVLPLPHNAAQWLLDVVLLGDARSVTDRWATALQPTNPTASMVARAGIEPATLRFSGRGFR